MCLCKQCGIDIKTINTKSEKELPQCKFIQSDTAKNPQMNSLN
jgi:hypothetical protein